MSLSLGGAVAVFAVGTLILAVAGSALARTADRLADATGLGEAFFGAVLLGGGTSLPGVVASVSAAWSGHPELAVSNAIGGIAAQTAFIVVADLCYRGANLEHASASLENLMQGVLLVALLAVTLVAGGTPDVTVGGVHPASILLVIAYIAGVRLAWRTRHTPLWIPRKTAHTNADVPDYDELRGTTKVRLWWTFGLLALLVAGLGHLIAVAGIVIADETDLSETLVGGLFTAVATSLPELFTSIAAARRGAATLAVADIIGGNSFDVLFIAAADVAYREGSIHHAISDRQISLIAVAILLTAILLLGMLRRERRGIANIGFEGVLVLLLYVSAFVTLALS